MGKALVDQVADGGDTRARGYGDQGAAGVGGPVDRGKDGLVGDAEYGRRLEGGQVPRAEALAGSAEDGAVADESDQQIDPGGGRRGGEACAVDGCGAGMAAAGVASGDAEVAAADEREDVEQAVGWEADGMELVEDFEDAAAGTGRVVKVLIDKLVAGELEEPLALVLVGGEVGQAAEEGPARDCGDVNVLQEYVSQGARLWREEAARQGKAGGQVKVAVGYVCPAHESDELVDVLGEVLGVDGQAVSWVALQKISRSSAWDVKRHEAHILPVGVWGQALVPDHRGIPAVGDGESPR